MQGILGREEQAPVRADCDALEGEVVADAASAAGICEKFFRQPERAAPDPVEPEDLDRRLHPAVRRALRGDEKRTGGVEPQPLEIEIAAPEELAAGFPEDDRVEHLDRRRVAEPDAQGVEADRPLAAAIVRDRVEEIAGRVVRQARKPADEGPVDLELTRDLGCSDQLHRQALRGRRHRGGEQDRDAGSEAEGPAAAQEKALSSCSSIFFSAAEIEPRPRKPPAASATARARPRDELFS